MTFPPLFYIVINIFLSFYLLEWHVVCIDVLEMIADQKKMFDNQWEEGNMIRRNKTSTYIDFLQGLSYVDTNSSLFFEAPSQDDLAKFEPVISPPLIQHTDSNFSLFLGANRKREVRERGFDHDTKMNLLQLHNLYRSKVYPPAGNMNFMEWDEELERLAQIWADGCVFNHGTPPNNYPGSIGQNLYLGSEDSGILGLKMWFEESEYYDFRKQACLPKKQCGHYVTMAWAPNHRLGCGMRKCESNFLVVCHYSPQALRKVQIYSVGKPCSLCSSKGGAFCVTNLCITREQCMRNPFHCQFATCDLKCQNCGRLDSENCRCECPDGWDSPDCSRVCKDNHKSCGKNPGFPSKEYCDRNPAIPEIYCRKMCEECTPFNEVNSTHRCCDGQLCENGNVLREYAGQCKCVLLCPGPLCDEEQEEEETQTLLQTTATSDNTDEKEKEEERYQASVQNSATFILVARFLIFFLIFMSSNGSMHLLNQ